MAKLLCEIVTPTHVVYRGEAALVNVPSVEGYAGILPGHELFSCRMQNGIVTVYVDEARTEKLEFASYMGFAQYHEGKVIVLSRESIAINDIDTDKVKAQMADLQAKIDAMTQEEKDEQAARAAKVKRNTLTDDLEWCQVQLDCAAKR